jgi:AcrR family transcriptional regulator
MISKINKKHHTIVDAATRIFIQKGYAGASMDLIAQEANVSKITIYKHFKNKAELFSRIMKEHCEKTFNYTPFIQFSPASSPRETLASFCESFIEALLRPESIGLMRRIIGEIDLHPELATQIWQEGKMPILEAFCCYLQEENAAKRLHIQNPEFAGRQLLGMIKENLVYPVWFGTRFLPEMQDRQVVIQNCIGVFLSYYEVR